MVYVQKTVLHAHKYIISLVYVKKYMVVPWYMFKKKNKVLSWYMFKKYGITRVHALQ